MDKKDIRNLMLCDKRTFDTKKDALLYNSNAKYRNKKCAPKSAYQCNICGKFHLTSQDPRKKHKSERRYEALQDKKNKNDFKNKKW
jgi:hypothetical protein